MENEAESSMTKEMLLSQLTNAKNNFYLGLTSFHLLAHPDAQDFLRIHRVTITGLSVGVFPLLRTKADRDLVLNEFLRSQLRTYIKEAYELIATYCKDTDQYETTFKSAEWFHFCSHIRNAVSHDFNFRIKRERDIAMLPASWRDREITKDMNNKPLKLEFFGYKEMELLSQDYEKFVKEELN